MNRTEIAAAIEESTGIRKSDVAKVLNAQDELIAKALQSGDAFTLGTSGKLEVKQRAVRTGRNPATGEDLDIPAKTTAKFKPSKGLLDALA